MNETVLIGLLVGVISTWFWYDKKKSDKIIEAYKDKSDQRFSNMGKELSNVVNKQTEHDNKFVTDQRVRDIVKDEIKPLKDDVAKITINITKIMDSLSDLTTELKVHNAIRDYEKSNK